MATRHLLNLSRRLHRTLATTATAVRSASTATAVSTASDTHTPAPPPPNQMIYDRLAEQVKSKLKRLENPDPRFLKHNSPFPTLAYRVSDDDVTRARNQLKSSLLLHVDGTSPTAEDIGRQICKIHLFHLKSVTLQSHASYIKPYSSCLQHKPYPP